MNTKLLHLNNDILEIIGDYVKKDNHDRTQKICKRYVMLYGGSDTNKESEKIKFLKKM